MAEGKYGIYDLFQSMRCVCAPDFLIADKHRDNDRKCFIMPFFFSSHFGRE